MSDYIKRENIAKYAGGLFRNETDEKPIGYLISEYQINSIPSADVAPVRHGRWKKNKSYDRIIFCDECGEPFELCVSNERWNYCPNCGARMDGEVD